MSETFGFTTQILERGRILGIALHGAADLKASLASLRTLGTTLSGTPIAGMVMDYSGHHVDYSIEGYGEIAKAYCAEFPAGFPVAFVYNHEQVARVIFMTRRLEETGRPSRAFDSFDAALLWLQGHLAQAADMSEPEPAKRRAAG